LERRKGGRAKDQEFKIGRQEQRILRGVKECCEEVQKKATVEGGRLEQGIKGGQERRVTDFWTLSLAFFFMFSLPSAQWKFKKLPSHCPRRR
jgi:hypothetical protein